MKTKSSARKPNIIVQDLKAQKNPKGGTGDVYTRDPKTGLYSGSAAYPVGSSVGQTRTVAAGGCYGRK